MKHCRFTDWIQKGNFQTLCPSAPGKPVTQSTVCLPPAFFKFLIKSPEATSPFAKVWITSGSPDHITLEIILHTGIFIILNALTL